MTQAPYGAVVAEHFRHPLNRGSLASPDASADGVNPLCGDRVRVELALSDDRCTIVEARFTADACAICIAAASLLTERLRGMNVGDARRFTDEGTLALLGIEIPAARRRCGTLPHDAAQRALADVVGSA